MSRTYADLLALAATSPLVSHAAPAAADQTGRPTTDAPAAATEPLVIEADDDPHRLARVNLERYRAATGGRTLIYWRDQWYVWKGARYVPITEREFRAKLSKSIKAEFDRQFAERFAAASGDGEGPTETRKVSTALVGNVLQATSGMVVVGSNTEWGTWLPDGSRPSYISMQNGLLDMDAVMANRGLADCIQPNSPEWFSAVSLPYGFDPAARRPLWDAFMERNLELDPERIKVCQEWAGYLLLFDTSEQAFMVLEGEGANGKSVFIAGLTAMLGEANISNVPLEVFGDRFARTDTLGKLLNSAGDCGEIDKAAEGYIKSFTGGDRMFFDRKGIAGVNCAPTARLMIACNNRPRFSDRSDGLWRRMLLIPWRTQIPARERVKGMTNVEWWKASGELPGIFNWALEGLARLKAQGGFTDSKIMQDALNDYKAEMNPARVFLQEHLENSPGDTIPTQSVYRFYVTWIEAHGYRPMAERTFGKEFRRCFPAAKRNRGSMGGERYWYYEGVAFSSAEICGKSTSEASLF